MKSIIACLLILPFAPGLHAQSSGLSTGTLGPPMPSRQPQVSYVARGDVGSGRSTITDLPLHAAHESDYGALKGPMGWVRGEKMQWGYSFPWTGRTSDGRLVPLKEGDIVTLLGVSGNRVRLASLLSPDFIVQTPPNITLDKILNFARLKLAECSDVILANRIGKPSATRNGTVPGETILVYSAPAITNSYTQLDPVMVTVPDFATGGTKDQLVRVPRTTSATYTPYFFEVHCSASGQVTAVDDHLKAQTIIYR